MGRSLASVPLVRAAVPVVVVTPADIAILGSRLVDERGFRVRANSLGIGIC
jgi:hypothetical protein